MAVEQDYKQEQEPRADVPLLILILTRNRYLLLLLTPALSPLWGEGGAPVADNRRYLLGGIFMMRPQLSALVLQLR
jgi:hypothetical protein